VQKAKGEMRKLLSKLIILSLVLIFAFQAICEETLAQEASAPSGEKEEVREFDLIYIKGSETPLVGIITSETETRVFVRLRDYNTDIDTPIERAIIEKIERRTTPRQAFVAKRALIKQGDYQSLFELAKWCLRHPELIDDAKKMLKESIKAKPDFLKAYLFLSDLLREEYEKTGNPTEAQLDDEIALYLRALGSGIDSARIRLRLGLVCKRLGLRERAKAEFGKALTLNEKEKLRDVSCDVRVEKADVLLTEGKYAQAEALFEEVLAENSDNFRALLLLGRTFFKEGNFPKAVENLQKALELDPVFSQTYIELAAVAYEQGDFAGAETLLETAQKYSLQDPALATDIAIVYTRQGKFAAAEEKLKEALAEDASYARAHFALGYLAESRGDFEDALRHYETARDGGFYGSGVSYRLAIAYYFAGARDKAKEELYRSLSLGFYPQDVFRLLARIEFEGENWTEAVRFLKYALSAAPQDAQARYLLALSYLKLNAPEKAQSELLEALKTQPVRSPLLCVLAYIMYNRAEYQKALALFSEAKAQNPQDSYAAECLEKVDTVLNQVFWEDNFSRPDCADISNGWVEENDLRGGIEIKIEGNKAVFAGTQRKSDDTVAISRAEAGETFVKFEAQVNTLQAAKTRVGISLAERSKDQKIAHAIILVKDERGNLSYNFTEQKGQWKNPPGNPPIEIRQFPSDAKPHTFAIKLIDRDAGIFKLLLDDLEVANVTNVLLARAKELTLSVFGEADANVPWTLFLNRVRISRTRKGTQEQENR
jgi:tetratricopeptide (TPR) repeat protein